MRPAAEMIGGRGSGGGVEEGEEGREGGEEGGEGGEGLPVPSTAAPPRGRFSFGGPMCRRGRDPQPCYSGNDRIRS